MKTTFIQNINQELEEPIKKIISPLDAVIMHMDEGRSKLQLQSIRQNATELQTLVKQLSKGALLPIPTDENNINLDVLIVEMRQLLEQQETRKKQINTINEKEEKQELLSETDEAFIRKVLKNVEQNLDNQEYSVETLSRDMGMDRTGLYRKLIALVGKRLPVLYAPFVLNGQHNCWKKVILLPKWQTVLASALQVICVNVFRKNLVYVLHNTSNN